MTRRTLPRRTVVAIALAVLAACGGGSGSSNDPGVGAPPDAPLGRLSLGLGGGDPAGIAHAWVTVSAVALHAEADTAAPLAEAGWVVLPLDAPVTVDLTAAVNGRIAPVITGRAAPAGRYGQMRLVLLGHDEPLAPSARALGLTHNAEVEVAGTDGAPRRVPLELDDSGLGLRVPGPFELANTRSTDAHVEFDLARSLVRLASEDGLDRFMLRASTRGHDLTRTGAIVGLLAKDAFCTDGTTTGCIRDAVATAQRPAPDGRGWAPVRSAPVVPGARFATFALYPLPALAQGETFDVVITGQGMRTLVIRGVPAAPGDLVAAVPTQLAADLGDPVNPRPLVPVLDAGSAAQVSLSSPAEPPSGRLRVARTPAGAAPHEVATVMTDPLTGRPARPTALTLGPLQLGDYVGGTRPVALADALPEEGRDGVSIAHLGRDTETPSPFVPAMLAPGAVTEVSPPPAGPAPGVVPGRIEVTIRRGASVADAFQVVVSDARGVVAVREAAPVGGTTVPVPACSGSAAPAAACVYRVMVRTWTRGAMAASLRWAHAPAPVDLRGVAQASVTVELP